MPILKSKMKYVKKYPQDQYQWNIYFAHCGNETLASCYFMLVTIGGSFALQSTWGYLECMFEFRGVLCFRGSHRRRHALEVLSSGMVPYLFESLEIKKVRRVNEGDCSFDDSSTTPADTNSTMSKTKKGEEGCVKFERQLCWRRLYDYLQHILIKTVTSSFTGWMIQQFRLVQRI